VQDGVRADLDEGVPDPLLLDVHRDPGIEDALVEVDQPVHVSRDERHVVDVVEQLHRPSSVAGS
jgi:hypothetical protein